MLSFSFDTVLTWKVRIMAALHDLDSQYFITTILLSEVIRAVQEAHGKHEERKKLEKEEQVRKQKEEKEKLESAKQQREIVEKAQKRKEVLEIKEKQLVTDEEKLTKEYELSQRMLEEAKKSLDRAIEAGDMVGVKVAREMLSTATKKLNEASSHRAEQVKIRTDVCAKRKCAFDKLMKSYKRK